MSLRLRDTLLASGGGVRHEPVEKRIRARLGERTVVDTTRAMLVWEPLRVVPSYAVPAGDLAAELAPARGAEQVPDEAPQLAGRRVLDPSVPFGVHTAEGDPVTVRAGDRQAAGFRPADPALAGYVVLEFAAFD